VAGAVAAAVLFLTRDRGPSPDPAVRAYLAAWSKRDLAAMRALVDRPPAQFDRAHNDVVTALHVTGATYTTSGVRRHGDQAQAAFAARLHLAGLGEWRYEGQLLLRRRASHWLVDWRTEAIHPALHAGLRLTRDRTVPPRAPILAADGTPLSSAGTAVTVGIFPGHVQDRAALATALQQIPGADVARAIAASTAPGVKADAFVPVGDLDEAHYAQLRPGLAPMPGVVFRRHAVGLAATPDLGAHGVGSIGEITAELLGRLGDQYEAGDLVGVSGLEAAAERQLRGSPSGQVHTVDASGEVTAVLDRFGGADPRPLATTLDLSVQTAAEHALDGVAQPAALVALQASTGDVKAIVSRPVNVAFDRALEGRYPPGSTFKVVTTAALLAAGVTPDQPVPCPPDAVVGGKRFTNFEGEAATSIPFRRAFAISCNTAFVGLASRLSNPQLAAAAASLGFGVALNPGLPAANGRFPTPVDAAEHAAAAIGQGRVTASPLAMADIAAAVAAGTWHAPHLVTTGAPGAERGPASGGPATTVASVTESTGPTASTAPTTSGTAGTPPPAPLDPGVVQTLRQLMTEVVAGGTGTPAQVPGGPPVAGKTGTAEFGPGNPPATHAWFIGFRGDLAFAVLVEGGGVGGRVAAPVAARFLSAVHA
jgi:cell division protein FtsI/penicillin-binding protein 2